ncbi:hypothetical protein B0H14DRAFT_3477682 [Mycena olivaceomarginata]|nr:hypothetical protein B0H14DRAFT_3477682 [Mycena olivaceomarginata]
MLYARSPTPPATLGPHSAPLPPLLTADGTPSAPPFCTISNLNTAPCALSGATRLMGSYALDCLHLGLLCALASSYFACSFASGRLPGLVQHFNIGALRVYVASHPPAAVHSARLQRCLSRLLLVASLYPRLKTRCPTPLTHCISRRSRFHLLLALQRRPSRLSLAAPGSYAIHTPPQKHNRPFFASPAPPSPPPLPVRISCRQRLYLIACAAAASLMLPMQLICPAAPASAIPCLLL